MKTPHIFSHTKPIIDLIVEDTGLHPDIVRQVLQSQYDIVQEEVFLKGHFADLCGLGSVAVYDRTFGTESDNYRCRRNRYVIKFKASQKAIRLLQRFNSVGIPEGVTYPKRKVAERKGSITYQVAKYYEDKEKK